MNKEKCYICIYQLLITTIIYNIMKRLIPFLAPLALLLTGCLTKEMSEATPVFNPDKTEITATAEFVPGESDSTKVLRITSNRSWSAHLNDLDDPIDETDPEQSVKWAYLSEESHPNLTNGTEVTDLVITFKRNYTKIPRRGVLHLYTKGEMKTINLNQEGAVYRLNVSAPVTEASDGGDFIPISVDCNTDWTVRIDETATTADAVLPTTSGFDPTTLNLRVKENEDKVAKTVTVIFSATDCPDQTMTFTQPATTSDLKVFEVFTKMAISGSGKTTAPVLVIDETMMDADALAAHPKYYYVTSKDGFTDELIPTETSDELPAEGLALLPSKLSAHDQLWVVVLGVCDGYRKTYTRIHFQDWKMGTKYTSETSNGVTITVDPPTIKTDYIQFNASTDVKTTTTFKGSGSLYYLLHNASKLTEATFLIGGKEAGKWVYTKNFTTNSAPEGQVSTTQTFEKGDEVMLRTVKGTYLWQFAFLGQYKYKP